MRFIVTYNLLTTIIDAETVGDAENIVADDLYTYERGNLRIDLSRNDILVNLVAREATSYDEAWYQSMVKRNE